MRNEMTSKDPGLAADLRTVLHAALSGSPRPLFPGAVALVRRPAVADELVALGDAVRYADGQGAELPPEQRVAMRPETIFDVASITKLFTATVLMALVEDGLLDLDGPIAGHLPSFATGDRRSVTLRQLLSHVSGLPDLLRLWTDWPDRPSRRDAVLAAPLRHAPGTVFEYSCIGYIVAGFLAERVTGRPLHELVRDRVCRPLGLRETCYLPPADRIERIAATEHQPAAGRGMVRGAVHDENSWSLGGTAGNAGLFSTGADLARFGEALSRGGELDGGRILAEATVKEMFRNQLPDGVDPGYGQGLGFRIGDPLFMGALAATGAVGHTGFTGVSIVIDPERGLVVILLTNRVHPSREWSDIGPVRRRVADVAAAAAGKGTAA